MNNWYGIICGIDRETKLPTVKRINLYNNNLKGLMIYTIFVDIIKLRSAAHLLGLPLDVISTYSIDQLTKYLSQFTNNQDYPVPVKFPNLQEIDLSVNELRGQLPNYLGSMLFLEKINLSYNFLSGYLPKYWSKLKFLTNLQLQGNHLIGFIPESFNQLVNIREFNIEKNHLIGRLHPIIENWKKIEILKFEGNHFNDTNTEKNSETVEVSHL